MARSDADPAKSRSGALTSVPGAGESNVLRPEFGRRWDDRATEQLAVTFARFLKGRPPLDEVARFLVALLSWPVGAQGAFILRVSGKRVETLARYVDLLPGWPAEDAASLPPAVIGILSAPGGARPISWSDPSSRPGETIGLWSLGLPGSSVGELVLYLATPLDPSKVTERVVGVAEILAVYLVSAPPSARSASPVVRIGLDASNPLTPRQTAVLELMAEGLTNRQIASRIGFSESTVRIEGIAVYRALGVHDRGRAVIAGRALGLLPPA